MTGPIGEVVDCPRCGAPGWVTHDQPDAAHLVVRFVHEDQDQEDICAVLDSEDDRPATVEQIAISQLQVLVEIRDLLGLVLEGMGLIREKEQNDSEPDDDRAAGSWRRS